MPYNEASFRIIGRIGAVTRFGKILKVSIASNYSTRDDGGDRQDHTRWNTVTVFGKQADWVETKRAIGDLVLVEGNIADTSYDKNGEIVYTADRLANRFELLAIAADGQGIESAR